MAMYTPRGLKVVLPTNYSFALMQRLYPSVTPFKILRMTEVFELVPSSMSFLVAIVCFFYQVDPVLIAGVVAAFHVYGHLICIDTLPSNKLSIKFSSIFLVLHGNGLYLIIIGLIGYNYMGWDGVVAYIAGRVVAGIVDSIIDNMGNIFYLEFTGKYVTMSEINFFSAFKYYARKQNISSKLIVSDKELDETYWLDAYKNLAENWPEVESRFTYE